MPTHFAEHVTNLLAIDFNGNPSTRTATRNFLYGEPVDYSPNNQFVKFMSTGTLAAWTGYSEELHNCTMTVNTSAVVSHAEFRRILTHKCAHVLLAFRLRSASTHEMYNGLFYETFGNVLRLVDDEEIERILSVDREANGVE